MSDSGTGAPFGATQVFSFEERDKLTELSKACRPSYVLLTPVYNEENYITEMIESILAQTIPPARWIIADDGSTDKTAEIAGRYAKEHSFITLVVLPRRETRLPGGEGVIGQALKEINVTDYDFIARFDADLTFGKGYISTILGEFQRDERLGIAGGGLEVRRNGKLEIENVPDYHVRGALKMYRRKCFEDIGGLHSCIGWDTIDEVTAWSHGWKTRSFFDCKVLHRRPTGEGLPARRIYWQRGKAEFNTWSHPLFVLAKSASILAQTGNPVKSASFVCGFASCYITREQRLHDPQFKEVRRRQQLSRIPVLRKLLKYNGQQIDTGASRSSAWLGRM